MYDQKALMQEMHSAFTQVKPYTLTETEVEAVYLLLCRLQHLEQDENRIAGNLRNAVNASCSCGGKPDDDPEACPACNVWHNLRPLIPSA